MSSGDQDNNGDLGELDVTPGMFAGFGPFEQQEYLANLPATVKRRVQALKKLQLDGIHVEAEFFKRVHQLECEYAPRFKTLHDKRKQIVTGEYEPTKEECNFPLIHSDDGLSEELKVKLKMVDEESNGAGDTSTEMGSVADKGVPDFWLQLLRNVELVADMIQEHDEPILKFLADVEVIMNEEPMGFAIHFHFSPNSYFSNQSLIKTYQMRGDPDPKDPFEYDGPEITESCGTKIDWAPGKDVTVKLIKKKQKNKNKGQTRFVTKQVKTDSFFNFFDPPKHTADDNEELDDDTQLLLHADFEIGQALRDRVVPRAALYFTGEMRDDDESYDEDDEDEVEEDGGDDEDSDDAASP